MAPERICSNLKCRSTSTPLWRRASGWKTEDGSTAWLCNACGLHWKKGHYCPFCNQIYKESDFNETNSSWIACVKCERCVHKHCDKESNIAIDKYQCPDCRLGKVRTSVFQTYAKTKKRRKLPDKAARTKKIEFQWTYRNAMIQKNKIMPKIPIQRIKNSLHFILNSDSKINGNNAIKRSIENNKTTKQFTQGIVTLQTRIEPMQVQKNAPMPMNSPVEPKKEEENTQIDQEKVYKEEAMRIFKTKCRVKAFRKMNLLLSICEIERQKLCKI